MKGEACEPTHSYTHSQCEMHLNAAHSDAYLQMLPLMLALQMLPLMLALQMLPLMLTLQMLPLMLALQMLPLMLPLITSLAASPAQAV